MTAIEKMEQYIDRHPNAGIERQGEALFKTNTHVFTVTEIKIHSYPIRESWNTLFQLPGSISYGTLERVMDEVL